MKRSAALRHPAKVFVIIALLVFIAAACDGIGTTSIGDIINKPRDFAGKKVTVSGEVKETFSLFVLKYFLVQDKTGQIAVVTDRPLPKKGTTIKVAGTVREAFSVGDQQLLVLVEDAAK